VAREYAVTVRQPTSDGGTELTALDRIVLDKAPVEGQEVTLRFVVADVYEDEDPPRIVVERR
jgi:hypothetical protein